MTIPFDSDPADPGESSGPTPAALAATESPIELRVGLVQDERTPEGLVCMATYRNERLVARCAMAPEAWKQISEHRLFEAPAPVVLVAREAPPGIQCQLFAMVTLPPALQLELEEEAEPWAASVPSSGYEAVVKGEGGGEDDPRVAPIPLGNIIRFTKDRVHPDSLPEEAADILRKIVEGRTAEVVDKALEDLLGG